MSAFRRTVEGRLKPNEYTDRNGVKTFKPQLVVDNLEFLDPRPEGDDAGRAAPPRMSSAAPARRQSPPADEYDSGPTDSPGAGHGGNEEEIPF